MSRIGKLPVAIPAGIKVAVNGQTIAAEGPKGKLEFACHPAIRMAVEDGKVLVSRSAETRENRALHGLTRALVANMVEGVQKGFEKKLELQGVGYVCTLARSSSRFRLA
jgi:large subunit ribosomal protein L6